MTKRSWLLGAAGTIAAFAATALGLGDRRGAGGKIRGREERRGVAAPA